MKELFRKLFQAPDGTPIRSQRYYVATNSIYVLAGGIHFLFIFFFGLVGAPEMMIFNIGSVIWFVMAVWFNRKGFLVTSLYLCFIEVYAHAATATYFFGWEAGYQYYALLFSTGIFLLPPGRTIQKFFSILIGVFFFAGIYYYTTFNQPIYNWVKPWIDIINVSNMIFSSLFHAGFAYYFTWSANQAENSLEREHNAQTAFFQNISHELRTPLTLISGPSEMAYRKNEPLSQDELRMVVSNSRRLTRLVNQLLDIQKISSGKIQLNRVSFDLSQFVKNTLEAFQSYSNKKGIRIHATYPGEAVYVDADPEQIDKCVYNFLSNALKFTPEDGRIDIQVSLRPDKNSAILEVKDTGVGIEPDQMSRLFSRFGISKASLTREQEGTGLGLSIVKEIIELHSGEVGCSSELGKGSQFYFSLPLSQSHSEFTSLDYKTSFFREFSEEDRQESTNLQISGRTVPKRNQQSHILIVEDNPDLRSYIGSILTRMGYMTSVASNGQEGIEKAFSIKPDVIVTDLMMPKKSGIDLIEEVRNSPELKSTPIVLLTAKADELTRREVIEEGASAYLPKPFQDQELLNIISNCLDLKERERELKRESGKLTKIQTSILQQPPKDWEGIQLDLYYAAAADFSGDYYFFQRRDARRYRILLFDISGHGVATSLVMGMLHLTVSHSTKEEPSELLEEINERLYSLTNGYFVTGIALEIDTKESICKFAKAGHTDLVHIREGIPREIPCGGKALGILPKIQVESQVIGIRSGDRILLYTDGLSEVRSSERGIWENGAFLEAIQESSDSSENFLEQLLARAEKYQGTKQFEDDVTAISITIQ